MEKGSEDRTRPMSKETVELLKNRANTLIERKELLEDDRFHERLYQDELTNPMNPNYHMQEARMPNVETESAQAPSLADLLKVSLSKMFRR